MEGFKIIPLVFWNPIPNHTLSISGKLGEYDAMQLYSIAQGHELHIVLEDNDYFYLIDYERPEIPNAEGIEGDVYAVVQTPEVMRFDIKSTADDKLNEVGVTEYYWPFFKMEDSSLLAWTREAVGIFLPPEKTAYHHVYVTESDIVEVIADRDPKVTIQTKK
ncbi:hypothetical protein [Alkalicoccus urumqiensis]|uniref:Uncharacterized protein n=1 Tax=Alkalicoccus urumqiensis TaxID=1548213 RepID=A0A2P6MJC8_ALKUR|nr:hypothetical protein [Alkalicoccus urumqiensis]PRO66386.1 hypothetical protein C6I21_03335 [Alkalicoccus urumqiensis]